MNKTYDGEIIDKFVELIEKNNNIHLLRKFECIEKLRTIMRDKIMKNKDSIKKTSLCKLIFFLILSTPDLVDEDLDNYILNEKLEVE